MGTRTRAEMDQDPANAAESDIMSQPKRLCGAATTAAPHMRLAMGSGTGSGGPSIVAQGQSDSAHATRAAVWKKMPKFFQWLKSLPEDHEYAGAQMFLPVNDDWRNLPPHHMIDRR